MRRAIIFRPLAAALLLTSAGPALAQAFTQAKGEGRVITSVLYSHSDKAYNDDAHATDIANYDQLNVYFQGEYGVTDDLTLLAAPSIRLVDVQGAPDSHGLGYTDLGARYRVAHGNHALFSIQGLVRIPGQKRRDVLAQVGQTDTEYDLRGQGAVTFGRGSFAILEGGYRWRAGDPPNDVHIDATLGLRATDKLWFIANSFNTISDGSGRGVFRRYRYHNAFVSTAYDVSRHVTAQLGLQATLAGRNALRERGLFGSVWYRF